MKFENLDSFIKKQVNASSENQNHDIEFDKVWTKVRPEIDAFYKKKKKRRLLFWLFIPFALSSLIFIGLNRNNQDGEKIVESRNNNTLVKTKTKTNTNSQGSEFSESDASLNLNENIKGTEKNIGSESLVNRNAEPSLSSQSSTIASKISGIEVDKNSLESTSKISANNTDQAKLISINELSNDSNRIILNNKFLNQQSTIQEESHFPEHSVSIDDISLSKIQNKNIRNILNTENLVFINMQLLPIFANEIKKEIYDEIEYSPQIFESFPSNKRFLEIGIGHSQFVQNPFTNTNQIDNDASTFSYRSLNFIISKRYNRRFSFSSGYHYIKQKAWVPFELKDIPYLEEPQAFENSLLGSNSDGTGVSQQVVDNTIDKDELAVKFLPGAEVNYGDLLDATALATIELDLYQVPFQIDYHLGRNKWEMIMFTGISLNYIRLQVTEFPIEIYKENILVSTDINFKPISRDLFIPNLILGAGIRYQFTEKYALHSLLNINPLDMRYARWQFGIMRRII